MIMKKRICFSSERSIIQRSLILLLDKNKDDIISAIDQFNKGTMVIPPSEWNPKIRIEPPDKFLSKVSFVKIQFK